MPHSRSHLRAVSIAALQDRSSAVLNHNCLGKTTGYQYCGFPPRHTYATISVPNNAKMETSVAMCPIQYI